MSTLVRWNPTRNLVNEFDRLFDTASNVRRQTPTYWGLAVDVAENEDGYIVVANVPGMNPDDLDITMEENVLTIKGEVKAVEEIESEQYHVRERRLGNFSRNIRFPADVNVDGIAASYENGVLTLDVPKAEEVKPKRITVKVE